MTARAEEDARKRVHPELFRPSRLTDRLLGWRGVDPGPAEGDPLHNGSGITMFETMATGRPTIMLEGDFLRPRFLAGAYRQMGLVDAPIATSIEGRVELAVVLMSDRFLCASGSVIRHSSISTIDSKWCGILKNSPSKRSPG